MEHCGGCHCSNLVLHLRPIPEGIELEPAIEKVRAIVEAHPRVLADPAPRVLLDHTADDSAIEIVLVFYTADDEIAAVKSDLIKGGAHRARCVASQPAVH